MKTLILLAILPFSIQQLTESQKLHCTKNDGGDIWKYDLTSLGQVQKPFVIMDKSWEYHIALCGQVNIDITPDISGDAIVQTGMNGTEKEIHVVGTHIIARYGGEMWVNLVLGGGDKYNHHCDQTERKAQILFICDPDVGQGKPEILDEANSNQDYCFYMFEWPTSLVCPKNAKGSGGGKGMSVFKLLLLEFVVIVVVYLVLGVGYKRFVLGARGLEQIPNLGFWKSCRDGMEATVNKVRGTRSGIGGVRSNDFTTRSATLNMNANDDDERLIM